MDNKFLVWLAHSPLALFLKIFVAAIIGDAVADWAKTGTIAFDDWQTWVIAALVAAVPVIIAWLNPANKCYGVGSGDCVHAVDVVEVSE